MEDELAGALRGLEAGQAEERVVLKAERTVLQLPVDACGGIVNVRFPCEGDERYRQAPVHDGLAGLLNALVYDARAERLVPLRQPVHGVAQRLLSGKRVNGIPEHQTVGGGAAVLQVFQQHRILHRRERIDTSQVFAPCRKTVRDGLVLLIGPALSANVRGRRLSHCDFRSMVCYCLQTVDEGIGKCTGLAVCPYCRIIAQACVERTTLNDAVDVN